MGDLERVDPSWRPVPARREVRVMGEADVVEVLAALQAAWPSLEVTEERIAIWAVGLGGVDPTAARSAVLELVREWEGQFAPPPAKVRARALVIARRWAPPRAPEVRAAGSLGVAEVADRARLVAEELRGRMAR